LKTFFTLIFIFIHILEASNILEITEAQIESVSKKIYQNECDSKVSNLVAWNKGEEFPSLGLGHFIWYPEGVEKVYSESFPALASFLYYKGRELPSFLKPNSPAPWKTREVFLQDKTLRPMLQTFLHQTMSDQAIFIIDRLNRSLPRMSDEVEDKKRFKDTFFKVFNSPNGIYALIDYVNFKGEGINPKERYAGKGWGLKQVLMCVPVESQKPVKDFAQCAKEMLRQRVKNAPKHRHEERWLNGWLKRLDTY